MNKKQNQIVKHIPLPKGWEAYKVAETEHPGEGWLTAKEFSAITKLSPARAYSLLSQDVNMQKCTRLIRGHLVAFYRPKGAAKKGK